MTRVLTPSSVGHYTTGVGSTGSSSYATVNGATRIPSQLVKYGDTSSGTYNDGGFLVGSPSNSIANSMVNSNAASSRELASSIAGAAGFDSSDYGDYIRQALEMAANNTAQSQAFAREQMEYQKQSDATAMAWSAQEAEKNRQWQERLSNEAHQREVKDLLAAGLNPILSANNGAYTGSGATGSGFSSSGASGSVDTSATGILGSMAATIMNTASQANIAQLYTDATRYQADMQYAASKLQSETSLYNNKSNIEANRAITQMNNQADIAKANISAAATTSAAGASAAATRYAADKGYRGSVLNFLGNLHGHDSNLTGTQYSADKHLEGVEYQTDHDINKNPVGYATTSAQELAGIAGQINNALNQNQRDWIHIDDYS